MMKRSGRFLAALAVLGTVVSAQENTSEVADPNDSRLFFAPTGRPMRQGEGSFSDHQIFFPGVSFGLTDTVTLMGGVSVIPAVGLDEQLFYGAVEAGKRFTETTAASVGYFYGRVEAEDLDAGIGFGALTLGRRRRASPPGSGSVSSRRTRCRSRSPCASSRSSGSRDSP